MSARVSVVVFLLFGFGSQLHAQDVDIARIHFDAGSEAYASGDYERAEEEFRASYRYAQHPDLLYNIYLAAERAGRVPEAQEALRGYLAQSELSDEARAQTEARLARLDARASNAEAPELDAQPEAIATPVIFITRRRIHPAASVSLALAGAFAVVFAFGAGLSEATDSSLASSCGRSSDFPSCTDAEVAPLIRRNRTADIGAAGAIAAGLTGLILALVLDTDADAPVQAAAHANLDGAGLQLEARF